jgi:hypothetical protein
MDIIEEGETLLCFVPSIINNYLTKMGRGGIEDHQFSVQSLTVI